MNGADVFAMRKRDSIRQFGREIASLHASLDELYQSWAKTLGITGPQWKIMLILADAGDDSGLSVGKVSKILNVEASFVTTQSKILEKEGLIQRKTSRRDGRIVNLSLTHRALEHLEGLAPRRDSLIEFIFAEFAPGELDELSGKLFSLKERLEKARLQVAEP
ncbi:MarR family transcriptional regulator [Bradyrhizobium sp. 31Argb]|uniref:MarR family winged helix-turn-helix transcriptional regulator n=1 Tax=unclassified Bradyrhizobium TaxID=2631580 RepID=UPI00102ECD58|nr:MULTISPECIES: MarR family transcriptional regulator [unclassified Bradyrhizobium]MDI4233620.1 MarR family transcriptional regulator [Bradyrhizobium sp. Arg237L]TAI67166.1 MarR family transcriptional regulator [Bradyrhizobium sp. Leo170]